MQQAHECDTTEREGGGWADGSGGETEGLNKAQISKGTAALQNKVDRRRDDRPPLQKPKEQEGRLLKLKLPACPACQVKRG